MRASSAAPLQQPAPARPPELRPLSPLLELLVLQPQPLLLLLPLELELLPPLLRLHPPPRSLKSAERHSSGRAGATTAMFLTGARV